MINLKFLRQEEVKKSNSFDKNNILRGPYKFSTQTTYVYGSFALVLLQNEIMKINLECDRIFHSNGKIGILKKGKLDIFHDNNHVKSLEDPKLSNVYDFPFDDQFDLASLNEEDFVFRIHDKTMIISPQTIKYNGKSFNNEIHIENCTYFVAYYENIAIIGNNKSLNFIYFVNDELKEVDDSYPLSLRIDNETFDSILLTDIKFFGSDLFLIDSEVISHYTVEELDSVHPEINIVEYEIKDNKILPISGKNENQEDKATEEPVKINNINAIPEEKLKIEMFNPQLVSNEISDKRPADRNESSSSKSESTNDLPFTTFNKETEPKKLNDKPLMPSFNSMASLSEIKSTLSNSLETPYKNSSVTPKSSTVNLSSTSSLFSSINSSSTSINTIAPQVKLSDTSTINTQKKDEIDPALSKFDLDTTTRIKKLINSYKSFKSKPSDIPTLEVLSSVFDIDGLYNLIFNNRLSDYEEALSSMIIKAEQIKALEISNIKESIKFFDSRIFEKRSFLKPAKYSDPLCSRFNDVVSISNPVDDILKGIKIFQIDNQNSKPNFLESKAPQDTNAFTNELKDNIIKNSNDKDPTPNNTQSMKPLSSSSNPSFCTNSLPQMNTQSNINNYAQPTPIIQPKSNDSLLFGNKGNVSNNFVVQDTSSLFNNLASNSSSAIFPQQPQPNDASSFKLNIPPATPNTNNPQPTGSAFNRLAGSRRLFQ